METIPDFEDLLGLFQHHGVRYLIVGGLALRPVSPLHDP